MAPTTDANSWLLTGAGRYEEDNQSMSEIIEKINTELTNPKNFCVCSRCFWQVFIYEM